MSISEMVEKLVNLFGASSDEEHIIEEMILEAYDSGYAQGLEDAETMYLD